jgi:hypothetical protein
MKYGAEEGSETSFGLMVWRMMYYMEWRRKGIFYVYQGSKSNKTSRILRRNCLLRQVGECDIEGKFEVKARRGGRHKQPLGDLKKLKVTEIWRRKQLLTVCVCGEMALEEFMDLSRCRLQKEWMAIVISTAHVLYTLQLKAPLIQAFSCDLRLSQLSNCCCSSLGLWRREILQGRYDVSGYPFDTVPRRALFHQAWGWIERICRNVVSFL